MLRDGFRFRWVILQLSELRKCSSLAVLEKQLKELPQGLDETYRRILLRMDERYHNDAERFLQWLAFSTRPLKVAEIAEVVVVDFDSKDGPECIPGLQYKDPRDVLDKCSGLVIESDGMWSILGVRRCLADNQDRDG